VNTGPSAPRYSYTWTSSRPTVSKVTTSRKELTQLAIAYAVLTADLTILFSGGSYLAGRAGASSSITPTVVLIAAAAALTGFVAHEMAHKFVAQRLGFWAEFRMSPIGLVFSIVTAFIGFLFAAPGATMVGGMGSVDRREWGETSLAGPLTNFGFAAAFYVASIAVFRVFPLAVGPLLFLAVINMLFAGFNLLPIGPLDGAKVLRWSVEIWVAAFLLVIAFGVVCYLASSAGTPFVLY
jgi:Zn-dependent protease